VPDVLQYRHDLARSYNNLGELLKSTQPAESEKSTRRAIEIYEKLVSDVPDVPAYRQALAASLSNLGFILVSTGQAPAAEAAYNRAIDIDEKLSKAFPPCRSTGKSWARSSPNWPTS